MLSVVPVTGNLVLSTEYHNAYGPNCRGNLPIPPQLIGGTGVANADYYLMVSARPIASASVLANALPCSHDMLPGNRLSRPLAGSINFNPSSLTTDPTNQWDFNQNIKTALHELTHALGFTGTLFEDYLTPQGGFYVEPVVSFTTYNGATKWKVTTPRVVAYVREHYGCDTLDGMELEDFNTDTSTPGAHWEARLVDSEYMAGVSSDDSQLSFLTLTFLEDMGWYKANYSWSEPFNYGRGEGCDWVQKPCSSASWNRYWCQDSSKTACNGHRTAGGVCGFVTYNQALPKPFEYFSDATKGGRAGWNDYCPVINGYSNRFCHDTTSNDGSNNYGEQYGPNCNCWDLIGASFATNGCYLTQCFRDTNDKVVLRVNINGNWQDCPEAGGTITIDTLIDTFQVVCPPLGFFCSPIGSSAVNFTFDPSSNIPIPNAPAAPPLSPFFGDIPLPPGLPTEIADEVKKILDEWGLEVGSTLFWLLIGIGIFLIVVGIFFCCCKR
jgi:leishmanolysin